MNSVPTLAAAVSMVQVRAMIVLARLTSLACSGPSPGIPRGFSRFRTGGGPGFVGSDDLKWRATENVLQGGAATMAKNSPDSVR